MAKNYNQNKTVTPDPLPRKIVIKRIMAFSNSYNKSQDDKKHLDLLKN